MTSPFAIVAHPAGEVAEELTEALRRVGFQVVDCTEGQALRAEAAATPPAVALVALDLLAQDDLLDDWRSRPETREVPLVALAGEGKEERRRALRLRLTNVIQEPLEAEDVVLAALAAAGVDPPAGEPLRGSLETLPPADLLSMVEVHRRSGRLEFREGDFEGYIQYAEGQVVEASTADGRRDDDAVEAVLNMTRGTFEARLSPRESNGAGPASRARAGRLLVDGEAPREGAQDSRQRRQLREKEAQDLWGGSHSATGAATDGRQALHTALTLINILGSFASGVAGSRSVTRVLEETRGRLIGDHAVLERFKVLDSASVSLHRAGEDSWDEGAVVAGVSAWARAVTRELEARLPGRFSSRTARMVMSSIRPELERHGFDLTSGDAGEGAP